MKTSCVLLTTFVLSIQVFQLANSLAIRKLSAATRISSIPLATRQIVFDADVGSARRPAGTISTTSTTSGGVNNLAGTSLNVIRMGSELVANALVSAVGGIATLINMIQNYAQTGSIQFNDLSLSAQLLTNRLLNLGSNAATTVLQQLSNEVSTAGSPGGGSSSGLNLSVSPSSQLIVSETSPVTQVSSRQFSFANGSWPQALMTLFPAGASTSGLSGIFGQGLSSLSSQQQGTNRIGITGFQRPSVSSTNTSGLGGSSGARLDGLNGMNSGNGGRLGNGGRFGMTSSTNWSGANGMNGAAGWGGAGDMGIVGGGMRGDANGMSSAAGWGGTGNIGGVGAGMRGGAGGMNGMAGWNAAGAGGAGAGMDDMDVMSGIYNAASSAGSSSPISTLIQTVLAPLGSLTSNGDSNVQESGEFDSSASSPSSRVQSNSSTSESSQSNAAARNT